MERLGFVIGLLALGLALMAFDIDQVKSVQKLLFELGVVVVAASAIVFVWPVVERAQYAFVQRSAPIPLGQIYQSVVRGEVLHDETNPSQQFMSAVQAMAQAGEITLLGLYHGADLVSVPPSHFNTYSLMQFPDMINGLPRFRTIKPEDYPSNPRDQEAYLNLHVPRKELDLVLSRFATRAASRPAPETIS